MTTPTHCEQCHEQLKRCHCWDSDPMLAWVVKSLALVAFVEILALAAAVSRAFA